MEVLEDNEDSRDVTDLIALQLLNISKIIIVGRIKYLWCIPENLDLDDIIIFDVLLATGNKWKKLVFIMVEYTLKIAYEKNSTQ